MIGFLIKKTFFDAWDNLLRIILVNMGFIASLAIPIFLPGRLPMPFSAVVFAIGVLWCFVYLSATALSVKQISDYGSFGFADFWANLKKGWPAGILLGIVAFVLVVMIQFIIPFYMNLNSMIGLLLGAAIFWTVVLALLALQFFFAVRARLEPGTEAQSAAASPLRIRPLKMIKKCFIIFFDNPGFSIFTLLYTAVTLVISTILAFLIPGPAGLLLFLDEALRLRLLKYDWLDANPPPADSRKRQAIPWDAILIEEREKTGTRSFRNFIFPWKD